MFGIVCGPYLDLTLLGVTVRCTCSPMNVPTAASGHMQTCPLYTPPAEIKTVIVSSPIVANGWTD